MRPPAVLFVGALSLIACDLGLEETQIGAGGAGTGASTTSVTVPSSSSTIAGSGATTGASSSAESSASSSGVTTSSAASTSTGPPLITGQVRCLEAGQMVDCPVGEVCCRHPEDAALDHCSAVACQDEFFQFECDGGDDCEGSADCCAPDEIGGDISCLQNCLSASHVVCEGDGDCEITFDCTVTSPQPYGTSYRTCQF